MFIMVCGIRGLDQRFVDCLLKMAYAPWNRELQWGLGFWSEALIDRARSVTATAFLQKNQGDILLYIDDDILFSPADIYNICQDVLKYKSICCGPYQVKSTTDVRLAATMWDNSKPVCVGPGGSVQKVRYASSGFMAIPRQVLVDLSKTMPLLDTGHGLDKDGNPRVPMYPFFQPMWTEEDKIYLSEDYSFALTTDCKILGANFEWKMIKDYDIGELVLGFDEYGTDVGNSHDNRRFKPTMITDKIHKHLPVWKIKTAYNDITTSADHQWIVKRNNGWKWMRTDEIQAGDLISTPVRFSDNPTQNQDYMVGYLKGNFDGDGSIYYSKPDAKNKQQHATLEQVDRESVERVCEYLDELGIEYNKSFRKLSNPNWKPLHGVRVNKKEDFYKFIELLEKDNDSVDYMKGYLAGFFDAEGCCTKRSRLLIGNQNREMLDKAQTYLDRLGISYTRIEKKTINLGLISINKTVDVIDFFVQCQPAIKRKCVIDKTITHNNVKVLSVEETGETEDMICLTTTSHTFIAEGLASHNCERAAAIGYPTYLDTRIVLRHLGKAEFYEGGAH